MAPRCFSEVLFCSFAMGGGAMGEKEKGRGERRRASGDEKQTDRVFECRKEMRARGYSGNLSARKINK